MDSVPSLLSFPPKLVPVIRRFNDYRFFMIDGGRSSGKSQTVARFILWLAEQKQLRIVCGREIQNSIEESVHAILRDLIMRYHLDFEIKASEITHRKSGSTIRFRGFREQGSANIKGLEGTDLLWVDEAQAITQETLDVIIPTIRKPLSRIFWTMNRHVENDPVYMTYCSRPDCLSIHIDYIDNPHCPEEMKHEAELCKQRSADDYNHIWLGQPLPKSDDHLFGVDDIRNSLNLQYMDGGTTRRIVSADIARYGSDKTIFTVLESRGVLRWEQIYIEERKGWDGMQVCGRVIDLHREFKPDTMTMDEGGIGGPVIDRLRELRTPIIPFNGAESPRSATYNNRRTEGFFLLKDFFIKGYLKIKNDPELLEQLLSLQFKYKSNGQKAMMSKEEMRKAGIASPDKADALMMAVYYCDKAFRKEINTARRPVEAVSEYDVLNYRG